MLFIISRQWTCLVISEYWNDFPFAKWIPGGCVLFWRLCYTSVSSMGLMCCFPIDALCLAPVWSPCGEHLGPGLGWYRWLWRVCLLVEPIEVQWNDLLLIFNIRPEGDFKILLLEAQVRSFRHRHRTSLGSCLVNRTHNLRAHCFPSSCNSFHMNESWGLWKDSKHSPSLLFTQEIQGALKSSLLCGMKKWSRKAPSLQKVNKHSHTGLASKSVRIIMWLLTHFFTPGREAPGYALETSAACSGPERDQRWRRVAWMSLSCGVPSNLSLGLFYLRALGSFKKLVEDACCEKTMDTFQFFLFAPK